MKTIFLSPHDDDNALFGAFTCLREKPLVVIVTDAYIQTARGEVGCDANTRANETAEACKILGCAVLRLRVPDSIISEEILAKELGHITADKVYAPFPEEGGNPHHNMIGLMARKVYGDKVVFYTTYTRTNLYRTGNFEVIPTKEELDLKNLALGCYNSQIKLSATAPHFEAVKNKSEWLIK